MNILHLKYAVEIANTKSISRAAENLYMGQPNLSRAIKELEESLNITIFNRTPKGITVTPEGEEFLQYARRIVNQVDEVEEMYKSGRKLKQNFSVCVPRASYISYAFAEFAKSIKTDIPADIFYKETNSSRTIGNVVKGEYNLGIVRFQTAFERYFKTLFEEKRLNAEIITDFKYVILMSKNHPLAERKEIYHDAYNLEEIEKTAMALGMVPVDQVAHRTIDVTAPMPEENISLWEQVGTFLSGLFA